MHHQINPRIYERRYRKTKTSYWLVKCQLPAPNAENTSATKTYQKKHPTAAEAELDRTRLVREFGGGSVTVQQLKEFEMGSRRLQTCGGDAQGHSPLAAIEWFIANYRAPSKTPLVEEVVHRFLAEHVIKIRKKSQEEYQCYLPRFVGKFGKMQIGEITIPMLQALVNAHPAKEHHRKCLVGLFAFCSGGSRKIKSPHNWLPSNPASHIVVVTAKKDTEPVILSVDEVKTAMSLALMIGELPYFVWCLFTGMRPEETKRFWTQDGYGWEKINLDAGEIIVNREITKTKNRRKILIRPVLLEWLKYFRATDEPMFPSNHRKLFRAVKKGAIPDSKYLVSDILRHTFISYRVQYFDKSQATTASDRVFARWADPLTSA